ncbi:MAG: helix-turn-helix transcriptional regulator [Celeribacter sp.]|jgi:AraC-like DNA-binding protein
MTQPPTHRAPARSALKLVPITRLAQGGRWRTEAMRSYRAPLLLWFTRGQGRITVAGTTRGYGPHNAIFVPPGLMNGFEMTRQVFGTALFFDTDSTACLPSEPLHLRIRHATAQAEVTGVLDALQREIDHDRPARDRAITHQAGLLSVWLERQRQIAAEDAARVPDTQPLAARRLVQRYTALVEGQLYTGQSVGDYAEMLGVTATHLSRCCNLTCNRSASDLLQDRLTYEARRLLLETRLPVRQVAEVLGFRSAAYFTRAFQRRTGQTPSLFRAGGSEQRLM